MKIFLFALFILALFSFSQKPESLKNTRWSSMGFMLHFTATDTVKVYMDQEKLADAIYSVKDSVLTWRDATVSEMSCDTSITGTYVFKIEDDVINFTTVKDDCGDRGSSLSRMRLTREK